MPVFCAVLFHVWIDLLLIDESSLVSSLMRMDHIDRYGQFSWPIYCIYVEDKCISELMNAFLHT